MTTPCASRGAPPPRIPWSCSPICRPIPPGRILAFEYHCTEADDSVDCELWYHTRTLAAVIKRLHMSAEDETECGRMYRVSFADGFQGDVGEDELFPRQFVFTHGRAAEDGAKIRHKLSAYIVTMTTFRAKGECLMSAHKDKETLVTIGEAAKYLGLSVGWVRLECERGRILFTRAGTTRIFKLGDLEAVKLARDRERAKKKK